MRALKTVRGVCHRPSESVVFWFFTCAFVNSKSLTSNNDIASKSTKLGKN